MAPVPDTGRVAAGSRTEAPRYTATGKVVEAHRMFRDYVVRKGDHLDAIARDLDTTRAVLLEANHLKKPDDLRPGQHLRVPVEKAYVAASGDTVSAVARRFDVSAGDLADLNAISESHRLQAGEELALPSSYHDRGPVLLPPVRSYARYASPARTYYAPPGGYTPTPWTPPPGGVRPPAPYPSVATSAPPTRTDSQVMAAGKGRFVWPVRGEILSAFGVQDVDRRNDGVDIKSPMGTAVHAAAAGEVVYAGDQVPGFGNLVLVKHSDGWVTAYAHLEHVDVKMRDTVTQDQQIGEVGQTGGVSEPQLHFEVRYAATPIEKARPVNPLLVLPE
jgi:murein DD-endopeptidase MepM/ murein hydrolase activator NlpD